MDSKGNIVWVPDEPAAQVRAERQNLVTIPDAELDRLRALTQRQRLEWYRAEQLRRQIAAHQQEKLLTTPDEQRQQRNAAKRARRAQRGRR